MLFCTAVAHRLAVPTVQQSDRVNDESSTAETVAAFWFSANIEILFPLNNRRFFSGMLRFDFRLNTIISAVWTLSNYWSKYQAVVSLLMQTLFPVAMLKNVSVLGTINWRHTKKLHATSSVFVYSPVLYSSLLRLHSVYYSNSKMLCWFSCQPVTLNTTTVLTSGRYAKVFDP